MIANKELKKHDPWRAHTHTHTHTSLIDPAKWQKHFFFNLPVLYGWEKRPLRPTVRAGNGQKSLEARSHFLREIFNIGLCKEPLYHFDSPKI
jgi:hypothetical protein